MRCAARSSGRRMRRTSRAPPDARRARSFDAARRRALFADRAPPIIAAGRAVGWCQGAAEFGPRALGNRSILADARRPAMQSTLNLKIKFRESFRPFAPAVLREDAADWFDLGTESPYMLLVAPLAAKQRIAPTAADEALAGHRQAEGRAVDDSGGDARRRLRARSRRSTGETNPRFHRLLTDVQAQTGLSGASSTRASTCAASRRCSRPKTRSAASWARTSTCWCSATAICARRRRTRSCARDYRARVRAGLTNAIMLELLRGFAVNMAELLLIFAGFALIERGRPAERGQPLAASAFNVQYLFVYQLINLAAAAGVDGARGRPSARGVSGRVRPRQDRRPSRRRMEDGGVLLRLRLLLLLVPPAAARLALRCGRSTSCTTRRKRSTPRRRFGITGSKTCCACFLIVLPMSMAFDLKPASAGVRRVRRRPVAGVHPRQPAAALRPAGAAHRGTAAPPHPSFGRAASSRSQSRGVLPALGPALRHVPPSAPATSIRARASRRASG